MNMNGMAQRWRFFWSSTKGDPTILLIDLDIGDSAEMVPDINKPVFSDELFCP